MPPAGEVRLHCTACQAFVCTVPGPLAPACPTCGRVNWMSMPNPREDVLRFEYNDRKLLAFLGIRAD